MKTRIEKIEEAVDRFSAATDCTTEKLEQRLKDLDTDTPRNKIIIWTVAAILAAIIISLRS